MFALRSLPGYLSSVTWKESSKAHLSPADLYCLDASFEHSLLSFQLLRPRPFGFVRATVFEHLAVNGLLTPRLGIASVTFFSSLLTNGLLTNGP